MDVAQVEGDEEFRQELRSFLERHRPDKAPKDSAGRLAWQRAWFATLSDHGYAAPAWPKAWGGMELPLTQQLVYHEEMTLAGTPGHPAGNSSIVGPTIIVHGTDAQRERFMKPMIRCDELWAQAWSEPNAGSDLPALATRAVRDGDHYVVTGQKIWSTRAQICDWAFALVRTGTPESRQNGLTYLLVDLRTPGIEVRSIRDMTGSSHFSEIFFDEARVPVANRVGEEHGGWRIARTSMGHERSTSHLAADVRYRRILAELTEVVRRAGLAGDPLVRQRLARLNTDIRLLRVNGTRVLSNVLQTGEPGPSASISRLYHSLFEQRLHEFAVDVLGLHGLLDPRDPHSVERGRWVYGFLVTRASTIGAGTAEIQRNTIAERVLGLPHDPAGPGGPDPTPPA